MRYRLVIFDFDGTLADSFPWFIGIINKLADEHGFRKIEADEVEGLRSYDARRLVDHLGVPLWKVPQVGSHLKRLMAKDAHRIPLLEGTDHLLRRLSDQGVLLAVVSSNSAENVRRVLGSDNATLITYYECGVSMFGKQARFRSVLRKSGVPCEQTLAIGDEIRDLQAARSVHIPFGAVAWGYTHVEALRAHGPADVFGSIEEVIARVV